MILYTINLHDMVTYFLYNLPFLTHKEINNET